TPHLFKEWAQSDNLLLRLRGNIEMNRLAQRAEYFSAANLKQSKAYLKKMYCNVGNAFGTNITGSAQDKLLARRDISLGYWAGQKRTDFIHKTGDNECLVQYPVEVSHREVVDDLSKRMLTESLLFAIPPGCVLIGTANIVKGAIKTVKVANKTKQPLGRIYGLAKKVQSGGATSVTRTAKTTPSKPIATETIPQGTIPRETIPQGTIPQATIPQGTIPQATIPQTVTTRRIGFKVPGTDPTISHAVGTPTGASPLPVAGSTQQPARVAASTGPTIPSGVSRETIPQNMASAGGDTHPISTVPGPTQQVGAGVAPTAAENTAYRGTSMGFTPTQKAGGNAIPTIPREEAERRVVDAQKRVRQIEEQIRDLENPLFPFFGKNKRAAQREVLEQQLKAAQARLREAQHTYNEYFFPRSPSNTAQAAAKKAAEEAAAKRAAEEAAAKRAAEKKRLAEEAAAKKVAEEKRLAEKAAEEKRLAEEAAAKKAAEEQRLAEKAAEEKRLAEEAAAKKAAEEAAAQLARQEQSVRRWQTEVNNLTKQVNEAQEMVNTLPQAQNELKIASSKLASATHRRKNMAKEFADQYRASVDNLYKQKRAAYYQANSEYAQLTNELDRALKEPDVIRIETSMKNTTTTYPQEDRIRTLTQQVQKAEAKFKQAEADFDEFTRTGRNISNSDSPWWTTKQKKAYDDARAAEETAKQAQKTAERNVRAIQAKQAYLPELKTQLHNATTRLAQEEKKLNQLRAAGQ
ncbi:MAG: hypothetical protein IKP96_06210, partial [Elusimicrobiaceae bacterium]|nr:hypothetical protein [Elusimicrobiaceae bacterium]